MKAEVIERIPVTSWGSGKDYVICKYEDGHYSCNCPAWIFHRGQKVDCKHIIELKNKQRQQVVVQEVKDEKQI